MSQPYLSAREAAAELNVSRATLYAYVSRGLIRSEPAQGTRRRLYRAEDVRALRARKTPGGGSEQAAAAALNHGAPVLDSAITLITDDNLYYRGRDAGRLARASSLENVAGLLWQCGDNDPFAQPPPDVGDFHSDLTGIERCQALLPHAAARDLRAYNLDAVARTGAGLVRLLAAGFAGTAPGTEPAHEQLAAAWGVTGPAASLLRAALVLCADHELNASTFTVRCVASTRATPYAAVGAGLAALQGPRHGGLSARVAALYDEAAAADSAMAAVTARLRRGERLPGFGHPLYPGSDPRYRLLRELAEEVCEPSELRLSRELAAAVAETTEQWPHLDYAMVMLQRALSLPAEAPMGLFAVGRCAGWIAHAQEQYARPELIRPRARYVGEQPQPAPGLAPAPLPA
ncbi:MAG: citrate synthase family protein [Alphaproteobacteria bacterium]|nr:citrate synthase family protein [Alphaproteobacteria bacterium]MDP6813531.1 citrate synthase family protein [Alphaproteobacteria bacterium]